MPEAHELIYEELHQEMEVLLPERCKGCGHPSKGLRRLAEELTESQITRDDASIEIAEAATDITKHCLLGYVASALYPDKKVCSFEIKPYLIEKNPDERNRYFDVRFEN